jgi:hypothetical protein
MIRVHDDAGNVIEMHEHQPTSKSRRCFFSPTRALVLLQIVVDISRTPYMELLSKLEQLITEHRSAAILRERLAS